MASCIFTWVGRAAPVALVLGLGLPGPPARAAESRAAVVVWAEDAFSRRPAERVEHLGTLRLNREPGMTAVAPDALVIAETEQSARATLDRANARAQAGIKAYENLEPTEAVSRLTQAVALFEKVPALLEGKPKQDYLKALTFLGASQILQGDPQAGQASFQKLLVIDRRTKLDKRLFPPGMVRMFNAALEEINAGARGSLGVFSSPEHAKVFVDGAFRGVTPCTVDKLPAGLHLVKLRKAGYEPWARAIRVEAVEERPVNARLIDLPGGQELLTAIKAAATELDDPLEARMQAIGLGRGLTYLAVGRLSQRDQGVQVEIAWYEVASGRRLRSHAAVLFPESKAFTRTVDGEFSYLITGREDVLQSPALVAPAEEPLRLKDEDLFEEPEVPVYERWYFWTAIGVGAATAVAVTLGVVLTGEKKPGSQILLEF